jgi:predicted membrane protein DUF2339
MADDRLEQLERRIAALEKLVRQLVSPVVPRRALAPTEDNEPTLPESPPITSSPPRVLVRPRIDITPTPHPAALPGPHDRIVDWEQWFGQRGLLAVGVAALLIAAAFFLKYAFDRGWIPPLARSIAAVIAGIGVAAWGHERIGRGMRVYGAAMIGAGGGLVYLGLWAAAGPYALVERRLGILLLVATTVAVTFLALHHEIEGLAIWALAGAYLAPIILATAPNPTAFLGYLEVVGLGTAILAYAMSWRATFNLALFGYLVLAAAGAADAIATPLGCWLIAAGTLLVLHVTAQRKWPEARLGIPTLAWIMLAVGLMDLRGPAASRWLALAAPAAVFALLWWQHFRSDPFISKPTRTLDEMSDIALERLLFIMNPIALLILAGVTDIPLINRSYEVVPATLAALYIPIGWSRRNAGQLIAGFALIAFALVFPWPSFEIAMGWTALAVMALLAERDGGRPGGRYASVALASLAWLCVFTAVLFERAFDAPVFTDRWAIAFYVFLVGSGFLAREWKQPGRSVQWMWLLCGSAVLLGGSIQFQLYFGRMAALAGNLALSVWWLLFAGALVFIGFRLNQRVVRSTGLGVAAFAGLKIVLVDLSSLHALYRVGSFFALAIIALAVAYAYNRRARASAA